MTLEERIQAFEILGNSLEDQPTNEFQSLAERVRQENPWFTEANVRMAVNGVRKLLQPNELRDWAGDYALNTQPKKIAVVMAGNIPMVGFHDFLCILICGHSIMIKSSSKDTVLMKFITDRLIDIEPRFRDRIEFAEQLKGFDAIIATGSDNASRYFEYYFGKYPCIIRKNRTSVAILHGNETDDELKTLGTDVFSYFGLGCRNVSKICLPSGFNVERLFRAWEPFRDIIHHHKYCNNYDYQKSILLVSSTPFLDNGFVMLLETSRLVSPIAVVYYEYYENKTALNNTLEAMASKIQCIVENTPESSVRFGQAQFPGLGDYADQVDTLRFLTELN
jgi:Acyl-CoA reductase (LuxC)